MKHLTLFETWRKIHGNYQLKRKIKIFLGLGLGGILLFGCLLVWFGITIVQKGVDFGASAKVLEQVQNLKSEATKLPALAKVGCWQKIQDLMGVQVWLEKPVAENINSLKEACLEKKPGN